MSTRPKEFKNRPASRERGASAHGPEQMTRVPARVPKEPRSNGPTEAAPPSGDKPSGHTADHQTESDDCARIMEILGTSDPDFAKGIYAQLISASSRTDGCY